MRVMCNRLNLFTVIAAYGTLALIVYLCVGDVEIDDGHKWLVGELIGLIVLSQTIASGGKVLQKHAEVKGGHG